MEATVAIVTEASEGMQVETWRVNTIGLLGLRNWLKENGRLAKTTVSTGKVKPDLYRKQKLQERLATCQGTNPDLQITAWLKKVDGK